MWDKQNSVFILQPLVEIFLRKFYQVWAIPFSLAATWGMTSFYFPPLTEMFYFSGCALWFESEQCKFFALGYPVRKSSAHRLLGTSPRLIAATPRPSSPFDVKASSIRPYFDSLKFQDSKSWITYFSYLLNYQVSRFATNPFLATHYYLIFFLLNNNQAPKNQKSAKGGWDNAIKSAGASSAKYVE